MNSVDYKKNKRDTGGGCSICGSFPCVNVDGAYWLCGPCVSERGICLTCGDLIGNFCSDKCKAEMDDRIANEGGNGR